MQGEGANTGRPAVFCRFTGCNLWSGQEHDRSNAVCKFCDTDFNGTGGLNGGTYRTADELADKIKSAWGPKTADSCQPFVVCTGGEPLLQVDEELIRSLHNRNFKVAIETNGTILPPVGIDWICVSPKADAFLALRSGNELKLVYPQKNTESQLYVDLKFDFFFLQPMDGDNRETNTFLALEYCKSNPKWRLSLQTHKILRIP